MTERVPSPPPKQPVVDRVMYGVGKFIDRHTPTAHSDRIITFINKLIIPKLKPEQRRWVGKHKDAIETAAVVAGVGITAAEITLATVFTVRMVQRFQAALEHVRATRPVRVPEVKGKTPHAKLQEVAKGKKGKEIPVVYDRTNELIMLQEMAADSPLWETPASRAMAEGRLVLRENERVDWDRLGLPDPAKKVVKAGKGFVGPDVRVDSYRYKEKTVPVPEVVIPKRGIGDAIRDKIEQIWPWSFQNTELRLRRKKFAAQRVLKEKRIADAAKKAKELAEKARLKQYGPMGPPDTAKMKALSEAYDRNVAEIRERTRMLGALDEQKLPRSKK
ncbi:hypothetical protein HZB58_03630 [Candidatus Gottesmanbacteria bacterium]|nr:hypothetical protein [Candidatus Gottesmanbacteria bacterium]